MVRSEHAFWLDAFSTDGAWKRGLDEQAVSDVLSRVTSDEVAAVLRELETNGLSADGVKLNNLLCHWVRISRDERGLALNENYDKEVRAQARKLAEVLAETEGILGDGKIAGVAHAAGKYLQHPLPHHRTRRLIDSLHSTTKELRPAIEELASTDLRKGPKPDHRPTLEIDGLIEIFEHLTEGKASRTYDPIAGREVGPFRAFCERALRMLDGDVDRPIDSAIRKALEDRAKYQIDSNWF